MGHAHLRDQGGGHVHQLSNPFRAVRPGAFAINPDTNPKRVAHGVVILSDIGVIQVDTAIGAIEVDLQTAVAERKISGHEPQSTHR